MLQIQVGSADPVLQHDLDPYNITSDWQAARYGEMQDKHALEPFSSLATDGLLYQWLANTPFQPELVGPPGLPPPSASPGTPDIALRRSQRPRTAVQLLHAEDLASSTTGPGLEMDCLAAEEEADAPRGKRARKAGASKEKERARNRRAQRRFRVRQREREEERKQLLDSLSSQLAAVRRERDRLAAANAELQDQLETAKRAAELGQKEAHGDTTEGLLIGI